MNFPEPHPGLVIRYVYLWRRESDAGQEEGLKDRPCAIVLSAAPEAGRREVIVLPVTHAPPRDANDAIEIPPVTKARLGLDSERSWVVISEYNRFRWPGPDLRPIPGGTPLTVVHGVLPQGFFTHVRDRFLERDRAGKAARVLRTE